MAVDTSTNVKNLPVPARRAARQKQFILVFSRVWAWVFLAVLILVFTIMVSVVNKGEVNFLSLRNSQNILVAITPILLLGLGQTFVIIAAGIDLSVGWVMGMSSVISALVIADLFNNRGFPEGIAIVIGFAVGIAAGTLPGVISGTIIAKLRIPSFIVTLGMSFIVRGIAYLLSGGNSIIGQPPGVRNFGNESLLYLISGPGGGLYFLQHPDVSGEALTRLDRIFTWPVVVTAIVFAVMLFVLRKTQFGRHTYAIGGNMEAARRAGVPVDRHIILLYALSAFTTSIAGVLHTARFSAGSPVAGDPLLLSSIAAVIIGGVSMFGGSGGVTGTVIGSLIIAILTTGLVMLNMLTFWQYVVIGAVVILAVLIDQLRDLVVGRAEST
jgi:ribose transport system permease protein